MSPEEVFATQYRNWFESCFSTKRVSQGALLDPFATSMRRTGMMVARLRQIEANGIPAGDAHQIVTDLASAGLAERRLTPKGRAIPGEGTLTSFGKRVINAWVDLGIDEADDLTELARCIVLVRIGLESEHPKYVDMYEFWTKLTGLQPASYWLQDGWHLYAPSFLCREDDAGFNPFSVIEALNSGKIWTRTEWESWSNSDLDLAPFITRFLDRVPDTRIEGRRSFCRAMELYRMYLRGSVRENLESTLIGWRTK